MCVCVCVCDQVLNMTHVVYVCVCVYVCSMRWRRRGRCQFPMCTSSVKMRLCWARDSTSWTLCVAGEVTCVHLMLHPLITLAHTYFSFSSCVWFVFCLFSLCVWVVPHSTLHGVLDLRVVFRNSNRMSQSLTHICTIASVMSMSRSTSSAPITHTVCSHHHYHHHDHHHYQ